jgi:hypothetical protein
VSISAASTVSIVQISGSRPRSEVPEVMGASDQLPINDQKKRIHLLFHHFF